MKTNALLTRVLWRHLSLGQIVGFALANVLGLMILLLGLQFYFDARSILEGKEDFLSGDYLVISKPVSTLGGMLGQTSTTFSPMEQEQLSRQSFVLSLGAFTPAHFEVVAGMNVGAEVSTYMFLESVPDEFLDLTPEAWRADRERGHLPIIIPRSYLALYNSAFSRSQGLPQISERTLGLLPLHIEIRANGSREVYRGQIVGFSDRLNTILVPEQFLHETNERLAPGIESEPTRLIVRVANPADPHLLSYLRERGYIVEGNVLETGEANFILRLVSGVILLIGAIISLLSIYLLVLSLYLLMEKNTAQIESLLLLGYAPGRLARPYQALCLGLELFALLLAWGGVLWIRTYYIDSLRSIFPGQVATSLMPMLSVGLVLALVMTLTTGIALVLRIRRIPAFAR